MNFIKRYESSSTHKTMYILEHMSSNLITNQGNNVVLLNDMLKVVSTVVIEELPSVYFIYKHFNQHACLLYDPNEAEKQLFLYVSFDIHTARSIRIPEYIPSLSSFYFWKDDYMILMTYEMFFYYIDFKRTNLQIAIYPEYMVKRYFSEFYDFCKEGQRYSQLHNMHDINVLDYSFIYKDYNYITYYNYRTNQKITINQSSDYYDVMYCDGLFLFISEKNLILTEGKNNCIIPVPFPGYTFAKTCFIKNKQGLFLFVLLFNESRPYKNSIVAYQLYRQQNSVKALVKSL